MCKISAQYVKACMRKVRKTVYFLYSKFTERHNSFKNWRKVMTLELDLKYIKTKSCAKFQLNMSRHVGEKSGKRADGDRTDGDRTDGRMERSVVKAVHQIKWPKTRIIELIVRHFHKQTLTFDCHYVSWQEMSTWHFVRHHVIFVSRDLLQWTIRTWPNLRL